MKNPLMLLPYSSMVWYNESIHGRRNEIYIYSLVSPPFFLFSLSAVAWLHRGRCALFSSVEITALSLSPGWGFKKLNPPSFFLSFSFVLMLPSLLLFNGWMMTMKGAELPRACLGMIEMSLGLSREREMNVTARIRSVQMGFLMTSSCSYDDGKGRFHPSILKQQRQGAGNAGKNKSIRCTRMKDIYFEWGFSRSLLTIFSFFLSFSLPSS